MFMGGFGTTELIVFAVVALVLFGHRLPGVMRSLGASVVEFRKGLNSVEQSAEQTGGPCS